MKEMKRTSLSLPALIALVLAFPLVAFGQWQKKPYADWSEKDALNVLNNSPWAQTQEISDTTDMFNTSKRLDSNQTNRVAETARIKFRVRFFSARPIRAATTRLVEIKQKGEVSPDLAQRLKALVDAEFADYIVITLVLDASEAGSQRGAFTTMLETQVSSEVANETYLLASGERIPLKEYQAPRRDGFGARFLFPRNVDGRPVINPGTRDITFHTKLKGGPTFHMKFKVKEMIYDGKLEY